ncbi:glycosyltransferase [Aliivibrio wodanis]|uniref:glycosyltransferase n=1 Tax=Aliivibrio wodanis TaxID=80852 RepID=UPI00406C1FD5
MKEILINASNLHVGGGVQVASSFIFEISILPIEFLHELSLTIVCSTKVFENLPSDFNENNFLKFDVFDVFGSKNRSDFTKKYNKKYDVCFTIFGPFYPKVNCNKHICGFAQPWIAYPNNSAYSLLNIVEKIQTRIKFYVQKKLFEAYDGLIVEGNHVRSALVNQGFCRDNIHVVSNTISSIYRDESVWKDITEFNMLEADLTLGFIGRAYKHKNLKILKPVSEMLFTEFGITVNFLFTLTTKEMKELCFDKKENFYTLGPINIYQCPRFYRSIDALIFPSLLECFSASPIEAMYMHTPVLASNYKFIRDNCEDVPYYFDPMDVKSIAQSILEFKQGVGIKEKIVKGADLVNSMPNARERAIHYINLLTLN